MKLWVLLVLIFILSTTVGWARDVTLVWEPSPTVGVDGYWVYYQQDPYNRRLPRWNGTGATQGDSPVHAGNVLTMTLSGLADATIWWFAVIAYKNAHCTDSLYTDEATCEANSGTWEPYANSILSHSVGTHHRTGPVFVGTLRNAVFAPSVFAPFEGE